MIAFDFVAAAALGNDTVQNNPYVSFQSYVTHDATIWVAGSNAANKVDSIVPNSPSSNGAVKAVRKAGGNTASTTKAAGDYVADRTNTAVNSARSTGGAISDVTKTNAAGLSSAVSTVFG